MASCGFVKELTDREDQLRLSRYLHDLGVCLHFQDDSTLKHYVILTSSLDFIGNKGDRFPAGFSDFLSSIAN